MEQQVTEKQATFEQKVRPAWQGFVLFWLLAVLIAAGALYMWMRNMTPLWLAAFALLPVVYVWWVRCSTLLVVKHDEVTLERGIFSKKYTEVGMPQVRSIEVHQTLTQRLFGVGDLMIASSGTSGYEIVVSGISNPREIRETIQRFQRKE
jgi:uncharacterized membrane protein YdbT with pleckstrin-like domain